MQIPINLFQNLASEIDPQAAHDRAKENALFVDVRELPEILQAAYDVPNVIILPMSELELRYRELPQDRELVIVCRGGGRSLRATEFLLTRGYDKVVNLSGGILRWYAEGFPTKGNPNAENEIGGCCGSLSADQNNVCCDSPIADGSSCC